MRENGKSWRSAKTPPSGKKAKKASTKTKRIRRAKNLGDRLSRFETVKAFVEANRYHQGAECVFVPGAQEGVPAAVSHCGRDLSAARYMCLLKKGTPPTDGMVVRHLCGNGHLSCINPAHLAWGTPGQNIADATRHRSIGEDATAHDKINAVTPN
ncbi:MAG: hypothetical protein EpisKO_06470 [Epibacterium sp.]